MSKLELQKRFKKENPNVFFTWATYTDWLEKRLEEAEAERERLFKYLEGRTKTIESSIAAEKLSGNECKLMAERHALAEITAINCELNDMTPGTETPDPER